MKRRLIAEIIAYLFVILFLYTGISKLMDFTIFREQIAVSPLLKPFAHFIAWVLPLAEFMVAALLFVPRWRLVGLYAASGLMVLFTGYIIAILAFDDHLPCSCGGVIELLSWKGHLVFNSVIILLGISAILLEKRLSGGTHESTFGHAYN